MKKCDFERITPVVSDIVGLLKKDLPLKHLINCNGDSQVQQKFKLTDGRFESFFSRFFNL